MSDEQWATMPASQLASAIQDKEIGSLELLELHDIGR